MNIRKNFEVFGYDSITGAKKTVPVISTDLAGVREQLRKAMPNFIIVAIYPEL